MSGISSQSKINRSAQNPHQNNSFSRGLAKAIPLKNWAWRRVLDTFAVKSTLTWPVKRPESRCGEAYLSLFETSSLFIIY